MKVVSKIYTPWSPFIWAWAIRHQKQTIHLFLLKNVSLSRSFFRLRYRNVHSRIVFFFILNRLFIELNARCIACVDRTNFSMSFNHLSFSLFGETIFIVGKPAADNDQKIRKEKNDAWARGNRILWMKKKCTKICNGLDKPCFRLNYQK